jgi:hypothetical protein
MKNHTHNILSTLAIAAFIGNGNIIAAAEKEDKEKMPAADAVEKEVLKPASMFPLAEDVTASGLEKFKDKMLGDKGWHEGINKKANGDTFYIGWATAQISVSKKDLRYAQDRIRAFEAAYSDAKGDFVRASERETTTRTLRELFDVDDDLLPDPKQLKDTRSRMQLIGDRIVTLTEAKLDKKLEKMGIDPKQFRGKPKAIKQKLARDYITRSIKTRAISSITGLRIWNTVEDDEAVGVLVVYSPKMKRVAKSIASGHLVGFGAKRDPKESILRQIKAQTGLKAENLYTIHGLRVMTDENGDRALVAFGQWAPQVTVNQSKVRQNIKIQAAREAVIDMASGLITDFVNATAILDSETTYGGGTEINRIITGEITEQVEDTKVGGKISKYINENGRSKLKGEIPVHTWTGNHPVTGHLIVGKIMMWSPASQAAMSFPDIAVNPKGGNPKGNDGRDRANVRPGIQLGDDDDF